MAIDRIALTGFANLLYLAGPDAEVAAAVERAIARSRLRFDFRHTLKGETVFDLALGASVSFPLAGAAFVRLSRGVKAWSSPRACHDPVTPPE